MRKRFSILRQTGLRTKSERKGGAPRPKENTASRENAACPLRSKGKKKLSWCGGGGIVAAAKRGCQQKGGGGVNFKKKATRERGKITDGGGGCPWWGKGKIKRPDDEKKYQTGLSVAWAKKMELTNLRQKGKSSGKEKRIPCYETEKASKQKALVKIERCKSPRRRAYRYLGGLPEIREKGGKRWAGSMEKGRRNVFTEGGTWKKKR